MSPSVDHLKEHAANLRMIRSHYSDLSAQALDALEAAASHIEALESDRAWLVERVIELVPQASLGASTSRESLEQFMADARKRAVHA